MAPHVEYYNGVFQTFVLDSTRFVISEFSLKQFKVNVDKIFN